MKVNIQAILNDPFVAKLNGVVSRGIKEADINEDGHLIFTLTDDSTVDLGKVVGETGPAGRDGRDGVDGQNGAPGRDGRDGIDGAPGQPGADGHSPVVTAQKSGTTTTIKVDGVAIATISDGAPGQQGTPGTPGRDGSPGTPGQDGEDGFSPTVSVTTITGGHRVTITDKNGSHSFDVMDGEGGGGGVSVHGQLTGRDASDQHPMSAITGLTQALSGKQSTISDLSTIRSGAALGATALQSVPSTYRAAAAQDAIDATKQNKLTAGENISIVGDVISATGGGGGSGDWRLIKKLTLTESANRVDINTDEDGNPFSVHHVFILTSTRAYDENPAQFVLLVNGKWGTGDPYLNSGFKPTKSSESGFTKEAFEAVAADGCANVFEHWKPYILAGNHLGNDITVNNQYFNFITSVSFANGKFDAGSTFTILGR